MRARGVAALLAVLAAGTAAEAAAQSWRTVSTSRQKGREESLDVRVTYGAGRFNVRSLDDDLLYRMQLRYDEDRFQPVSELDGGRLRLGIEGTGGEMNLGTRRGGEMELELARGVSMELELAFGAVEADVDLGGLSLTRLQVETGASESRVDVSSPNPLEMRHASFQVGAAEFTARRLGNLNARTIEVNAGVGDVTLDLTGAWARPADVRVKMGLGSLRLRFPEGLGVRLRKKTFLTALDAQGLVKRGDDYYSPDWETAERRITVEVEAAFGSIDVGWVR
ncbi:MAG: hypothetical protein KY453_02385 [Gemmatimonadetes bacterium]|nr:hypothetical protein [Gemmatimonadota bacterium]